MLGGGGGVGGVCGAGGGGGGGGRGPNEVQRRMNKERMSGSEEESKLLPQVVS